MRKGRQTGTVQSGEEEAQWGSYQCIQTPEMRVQRGQGQVLFNGSQCQKKSNGHKLKHRSPL